VILFDQMLVALAERSRDTVVGQSRLSHYNSPCEVEKFRTGNSVKHDWATRWGGLFCLMDSIESFECQMTSGPNRA